MKVSCSHRIYYLQQVKVKSCMQLLNLAFSHLSPSVVHIFLQPIYSFLTRRHFNIVKIFEKLHSLASCVTMFLPLQWV